MRFFRPVGWFLLLLLPAMAGGVHAQMPIQGKDYKLIEPPQRPSEPGKIEVIEFFSYACPHCAHFEAPLKDWLKRKPKDVAYRPVPVVFRASWKPLAKLFYTLETMDLVDQYHDKVFAAIHQQGEQLFTDEAVIGWAGKQKLDSAKFTQIYNSFGIDAKVQRAMAMARAYGVQFTPSLAVNGKYYTGPSMVTSGGGGMDLPRFFAVLDQLIILERNETAATGTGKPKG